MSLKRNIIANYIGQVYTIGIGIVITPLYLRYLGAEPYGLVGIFALMQAWMSLLDVGISPTLGRQTAVMRGQEGSAETFWILLKSFETLFMGLAVLMVAAMFTGSHWLAQHWLKVQTMELGTVIACLQLMGVMIGLRWFAALYRSGINGMEDQIWLNTYNIIIISFKFIGGLILIATISNEIVSFFVYQFTIGCLELIMLMRRFYSRISRPAHARIFNFDWRAVKTVTPFAMGVAYTSGVWTLITQTDKLLLSRVLNLEDYGYFMLINLAANGILLSTSPISQSLKPRLTYLFAKGEIENLVQLYRNTMQVSVVVSVALCAVFIMYSEKILFAWTGNNTLAQWGAEPLIWFSIGNSILALSSYTYYLQAACGNLSLHIKYSTILGFVQVPIIYVAANHWGAVGAGFAWCFIIGVSFVIWTPIIHSSLFSGFEIPIFSRDIVPVALPIIVAAAILKYMNVLTVDDSRFTIFLKLMIVAATLFTVGFSSTRLFKSRVKNLLVSKVK